MATTPKLVGPADPALIKSFENQTPSVARTSPPTVSATGTATSTGGTVSRSIAPRTSGDTTTYNQATQSSSGTELFIVSSNNNDSNDIVTVYNTQKEISVSAVNQTINNYRVTNSNSYGNSNVAAFLPTYDGNLSSGNLVVNGVSDLGSVSNVRIEGGTGGQVLSTNGSGALVWSNVSPGPSLGNWEFRNDTMYNMAGGEINNGDTTHGATAGLVLPENGNAGLVTSLFNTYGNAQIAVANLANSANTSVWNFGVDGNLTLPNIANVSINYANGDPYGGGSANTGNVTFDNINVIGTGNLNLQPDPTDTGAYLDIYLTGAADIHVAAGAAGANVILGTDEEANVAVLQGGNVAIQAGNVSGTKTWTFDTTGDINIPPNAASFQSGRIQSANGYPTLLGYGSGEHGGPELDWMNGDDPNNMGVSSVLRNTLYLNNEGLYVGVNENVVANTFTGSWKFTSQGTTIFPTLEVDIHNGGVQSAQTLQFGGNQQAIITGPTPTDNNNAQRLIIQGQRGNGTGEGGDVYVWGGDADTNGGDIKIYAGNADNVAAGTGGYVNIDGGDGFDNGGGITLTGGISANGYGGTVNITGGSGELEGGSASLQGGYGGNGQGGTVQLTGGGSSNGQASYGNVEIGSGTYAWLFNNSGNLVLPGNTFAVNYANGTQVTIPTVGNIATLNLDGNVSNLLTGNGTYVAIPVVPSVGNIATLNLDGSNSNVLYGNGVFAPASGGGTGGIVFEYNIANFTANALPTAGTMQFTNRNGEVVAPADGTRLWINATDDTGILNGSTWLAMAQNSERGTITLQQANGQQAIRVNNIGVYNDPEVYRGYRAGVNQIWGDDPSINQIIITNAAAPIFYNEEFDISDDVFHATNLTDATAVYMVNVYGSNDYTPLTQNELWSFFTNFVDNVLYQNTDTETFNVTEIRTAFYTNFSNFYNSISASAYDRNFRFVNETTYYNSAVVTGGTGTLASSLRVRLNVDYSYTIMGINDAGAGYTVGDSITVTGDQLNGTTPTNDITLTVNSVDGNGGITAVVINSGVSAYPWRTNSISDGGNDQYDTGNRINTNLAQSILYGGGNVTVGTTEFGTGSEYAVMYNTSVFCMAATGVAITDLYYSGNLGADGDGFIRWSGLRNTTNSGANVQYAYMECELGTSNLTPTVGTLYQLGLDSGGINLDQFYSYYNDADNHWYFGANQDWRLESTQELDIQSYQTLTLRTLIPNEAANANSPSINITTDRGSDGNVEFGKQAGSGGSITIQAGDAGNDDGVPTLGANGGSVTIQAGDANGNNQYGGDVTIESGSGDLGYGGNLKLRARNGAQSNGQIQLTTNYGNTDKTWAFNSDGTVVFPTLTVDIHNGGNQTAQTLQFGDSTQQAIITGPTPSANTNAQRLIIQGQRGLGTGEGGDVYLWAGDTDGTNGGDIKIYAGDADNVAAGSGGYINLAGGDGFDNGGAITLNGGYSANGYGGQISITGGQGQIDGGPASITGGYAAAGNGGAVNITGGTSSVGPSAYGNVEIGSGIYGWSFNNEGNLVLPGNTFAVNYANGTQVSISGGSGNTGNVTFDDNIVIGTGDEFGFSGLYLAVGPDSIANGTVQYLRVRGGDAPTHIHLDTGNNQFYDQYFGDDGKFVRLDAGDFGNVTIGTQNPGNSFNWSFTSDGNLIFPRDAAGNIDPILSIVGGATPTIQSTDASLAGPANLAIQSDYLNLSGFSGDKIVFYADTGEMATDANMTLTTNLANTGNTSSWVFGTDGNLTIPSTLGGFIKTASNASIGVAAIDNGTNNPAQLLSINAGSGAATSIVSAYATNATIQTNASGNINTWSFNNAGSLTLPGGAGFTIGDAGYLKVNDGVTTGMDMRDSTGRGFYTNNDGFAIRSAGDKTYQFNANGNLTLPTNGQIIVSGGLVSGGASPAPTINGFSITNSVDISGNGNIAGNNISATGNITANNLGNIISINLDGNVSNLLTGNGTYVAIPVVPTVGNIATINLDGNVSNVLNGNGVFAVVPAPTVAQDITSNGAMSIMTYDGNLKYVSYATVEPSTGNIAGGNISTTGIVTANIANITTGNITTINSGLLQNGNSNITLTANGNVSIQAAGSTVELVITSTGANITGTANITGNANVANIGATDGVFTGNISGNTNGFSIGYLNIPQVAASNATLGLTDAGKHYYSTSAGNFTLSIPLNSSVAFATGTAISIVVQSAGNVLVNAISGVTLYMAGNSTAANRVVSNYGMATIMKVATNTWMINGTGVA